MTYQESVLLAAVEMDDEVPEELLPLTILNAALTWAPNRIVDQHTDR